MFREAQANISAGFSITALVLAPCAAAAMDKPGREMYFTLEDRDPSLCKIVNWPWGSCNTTLEKSQEPRGPKA